MSPNNTVFCDGTLLNPLPDSVTETAAVAEDALDLGRHVFLYSDNVAVADEAGEALDSVLLRAAAGKDGGPDPGGEDRLVDDEVAAAEYPLVIRRLRRMRWATGATLPRRSCPAKAAWGVSVLWPPGRKAEAQH